MRLGKKNWLQACSQKTIGILPPTPGKSAKIKAGKGLLTIFWTGVDQWIVEAPYATHADIAVQLNNILKITHLSQNKMTGWRGLT